MPDQALLLRAMGVAAVLAAAGLLIGGWPWRAPKPVRVAIGWAVGVGIAFVAGNLVIDPKMRWLKVDRDRLLEVLVPATVLVECIAAFPKVPRWLAWALRAIIAFGAARVVLDNSVYIADLSGPDSREWNETETLLKLAGLGTVLLGVWAALACLVHRAPGRSVPLALAVCSGAASVTIMYSESLTAGQGGLPLASALIGATAASLLLPAAQCSHGSVGMGVVALFGVLAGAHFFAGLTLEHAAMLFLAPLLCWLPELPRVRKLWPSLRGVLRVAVVALPLALAVWQAKRTFDVNSQAPGAAEAKEMRDAYENFVPPP